MNAYVLPALLANELQGFRDVIAGHIINVVLMRSQVVCKTRTATPIQTEDIWKAIFVQSVHEVFMLRHNEHICRGCKPVNQQDHVFRFSGLKALHRNRQTIVGVQRMQCFFPGMHTLSRVQWVLVFFPTICRGRKDVGRIDFPQPICEGLVVLH
ncbi:hypothetical protein D3C87_1613670 [compost metagenome]